MPGGYAAVMKRTELTVITRLSPRVHSTRRDGIPAGFLSLQRESERAKAGPRLTRAWRGGVGMASATLSGVEGIGAGEGRRSGGRCLYKCDDMGGSGRRRRREEELLLGQWTGVGRLTAARTAAAELSAGRSGSGGRLPSGMAALCTVGATTLTHPCSSGVLAGHDGHD
jgi:hypothetical protein